MEQQDLELIEKYSPQDAELKALWDLHLDYEKTLEKLSKRPYLKPHEEVELREIKKKKLAGKTRLQSILDRYKSMEA